MGAVIWVSSPNLGKWKKHNEDWSSNKRRNFITPQIFEKKFDSEKD